MIDITAFKFTNINVCAYIQLSDATDKQKTKQLTVAIKFAPNLLCARVKYMSPKLKYQKYSRHHEEDQAVIEDEANDLRPVFAG